MTGNREVIQMIAFSGTRMVDSKEAIMDAFIRNARGRAATYLPTRKWNMQVWSEYLKH